MVASLPIFNIICLKIIQIWLWLPFHQRAQNKPNLIDHKVDFAQTLIIAFLCLLHMRSRDGIMMKQNAPFLLYQVNHPVCLIDEVFELIFDCQRIVWLIKNGVYKEGFYCLNLSECFNNVSFEMRSGMIIAWPVISPISFWLYKRHEVAIVSWN